MSLTYILTLKSIDVQAEWENEFNLNAEQLYFYSTNFKVDLFIWLLD